MYFAAQSPIGDQGHIRSPSEIVSPISHLASSFDAGKDVEALINIEVTFIGNSSMMCEAEENQNNDSYLFCSVQFNALDVIGKTSPIEIISNCFAGCV